MQNYIFDGLAGPVKAELYPKIGLSQATTPVQHEQPVYKHPIDKKFQLSCAPDLKPAQSVAMNTPAQPRFIIPKNVQKTQGEVDTNNNNQHISDSDAFSDKHRLYALQEKPLPIKKNNQEGYNSLVPSAIKIASKYTGSTDLVNQNESLKRWKLMCKLKELKTLEAVTKRDLEELNTQQALTNKGSATVEDKGQITGPIKNKNEPLMTAINDLKEKLALLQTRIRTEQGDALINNDASTEQDTQQGSTPQQEEEKVIGEEDNDEFCLVDEEPPKISQIDKINLGSSMDEYDFFVLRRNSEEHDGFTEIDSADLLNRSISFMSKDELAIMIVCEMCKSNASENLKSIRLKLLKGVLKEGLPAEL